MKTKVTWRGINPGPSKHNQIRNRTTPWWSFLQFWSILMRTIDKHSWIYILLLTWMFTFICYLDVVGYFLHILTFPELISIKWKKAAQCGKLWFEKIREKKREEIRIYALICTTNNRYRVPSICWIKVSTNSLFMY